MVHYRCVSETLGWILRDYFLLKKVEENENLNESLDKMMSVALAICKSDDTIGFGFGSLRNGSHTSERTEGSPSIVLVNMDRGGCDLSNLSDLQLEVGGVVYSNTISGISVVDIRGQRIVIDFNTEGRKYRVLFKIDGLPEREWNIFYGILCHNEEVDDSDEVDVFETLKMFSEQYPFSIAKAIRVSFYLKDVRSLMEAVNGVG